jgi:hypothetical protein
LLEAGQEAGDPPQGPGRGSSAGVHRADRQPGLAGVAALPRHGVEQQRARGDDLAVMIRVDEAQAPPVVNQPPCRPSAGLGSSSYRAAVAVGDDRLEPSNLARGGVVVEADLVAALEAGEIAGAALDVFETEPLPAASPLWAMDNVLVTPHVAGTSDRYMKRAIDLFLVNLESLRSSGVLATPIDRDAGY